MEYREEDFLQLSGIQHFLFCRRQWALIHIEQQWAENLRTVEGKLMHKNAHDPDNRSKRGDILTVKALRVHSSKLGISGECDAVEFHSDPDGITLANTAGRWIPYPVEYKKGMPKPGIADAAQLCAQAICLEEMLCCNIPEGALYYGETRHREKVIFTDDLKRSVFEAFDEMHKLYEKGYTPLVKRSRSCNACSLKDICLPALMKTRGVEEYMKLEGGLEE